MTTSMLPGSTTRPQPETPKRPGGSFAPPPAPAPVTPASDDLPPVEAEGKTASADGADKTPAPETAEERYLKALKDAKIAPTTASGILDAMLTHGFYEESVSILGRPAVLRTRNYQDSLRIQQMLERDRLLVPAVINERISMYTLASSLRSFANYTSPISGLEKTTKESNENFEAALMALEKMPHPVIYALQVALVNFDNKITLVSSDGATAVF
jgi:hypothetical protein